MVENNYYERKIKYLDLMDNGERTGGAGFIKTEVRGMDVSMAITVRGLHPTDTYERDIMLQAGDGEFAIGRISLKEGQGEFKYHTVMDHSQLQEIRIALGGTREICCKLQEKKSVSGVWENTVKEDDPQENGQQNNEASPNAVEDVEEGKQQRTKKSREIQLIPWDEIKMVEESLERVEKIMSRPVENNSWKAAEKNAENEESEMNVKSEASERSVKEVTERERTARERRKGEFAGKPGRSGERPTRTEGRDLTMDNRTPVRNAERKTEKTTQRTSFNRSLRQEKRPVRLMEDKWQQIWAIYPHIHPFKDEREYLSISPADFVLLPDQAYRAANNSFLLHGYYNYDHLILTRIEKRGEISYYIGVPGNYYEREKQVAIMFGFESFECGTEPAQAGDFGYYMMRTQL